MEPLKFAYPLSNWLLRVALLILVYMCFYGTFHTFDYHHLPFWIATGFGIFAALLFIGGFMKKHNLTIISAIILISGCGYKIFMHYAFGEGTFVANFAIFGAIAFYFATAGNRKK
jgi:hypothetical protein